MGLPCRLLLVASAGLAGALDVAAAREDAARSDATRARRVDAIVAAFVADAAAMPLHWIYDTDDLAAILAREHRAATPEFLPESHAPYYAYPPGEQTPFGEQMLDAETNAVAHVLPVAAARAGFDDFLESCEAAIRVVQDNDDAVAFGLAFARILEAVILGSTVDDAVRDVREALARGTGNRNDAFFARGLAKMDAWRARPPFDVTLELGQACDFPFHIFTAPHMLLHNMSSLVAAVRETIVIGGENANRGSFVASILAAAGGEVPDAWLEQTARGAEVRARGARPRPRGRAAAPLPDAAAAIANATFVDVAGNDVACSPAVAAWVRSREFGFGC
ncbi:ADP-ribosylglycohydrolase [Aureococcus anophagefferens]|nr:ADP-ribosylglycohydrolase [Aureococcus anophagefferens]